MIDQFNLKIKRLQIHKNFKDKYYHKAPITFSNDLGAAMNNLSLIQSFAFISH